MSSTRSRESNAGDRSSVRIVRDLEFPRESIFRMITDPKSAAKWFGIPEGAVADVFELDARPGGRIRIHDRQAEGGVHETTGVVVELVEPDRFSYRSTTTLEKGAVPFEALQTMTLEALGPQRTRVVVVVKVLTPGSFAGGVASLLEGFEGGWGQTLDKLERELR